MSLKNQLETIFTEHLQPIHLEVVDDSARHAGHQGAREGGGHYIVTVVSAAFEGLSLVERHQRVYKILGDLMKTRIHALALTTRTPDEWAKRFAKS